MKNSTYVIIMFLMSVFMAIMQNNQNSLPIILMLICISVLICFLIDEVKKINFN
jgi:hypothetical protein